MTPLAALFLSAATTSNDSTDVLWRNVNLDDVMFVGVSPREALLDEIIKLNAGNPDRLYRIGRLIVGSASTSCALNPGSPVDLLRGIVDSSVCERSTLTTLCGHVDPVIATLATERLTYLDGIVQNVTDASKSLGDKTDSINALMCTLHVESLAGILDSSPDTIVWGLNRIVAGETTQGPNNFPANVLCPADRGSWLHRLSILDAGLYTKVMLSILYSEYGFVDERVATWAVNDTNGLEYLEGLGKNIRIFTKRCDANATDVLFKQGLLNKPTAAYAPKSFTSLDSMIGLLTPDELGAMLFSTNAKAAESTVSYVLDSASLTMIANFMFGNTMRKPKIGEITGMLTRSSLDRKLDLAKVLNSIYTGSSEPGAPSPHGERIAYLPWVDELLLAFTRLHIPALREETAVKLFATVSQAVGSDAASWEYLMVLCNEWNSTFIDLLDSAAAIVK